MIMPTSPHDPRLIVAGAKLLEMDGELSQISDSLREGYPDTDKLIIAMRGLIYNILQDLREESYDGEDDE